MLSRDRQSELVSRTEVGAAGLQLLCRAEKSFSTLMLPLPPFTLAHCQGNCQCNKWAKKEGRKKWTSRFLIFQSALDYVEGKRLACSVKPNREVIRAKMLPTQEISLLIVTLPPLQNIISIQLTKNCQCTQLLNSTSSCVKSMGSGEQFNSSSAASAA